MAPNRKKKKPVANPNRGFATVSIASKQRTMPTVEASNTHKHDEGVGNEANDVDDAANVESSHQPARSERQVVDMTAEELEIHLDNADLQNLIDSNGEKIKQQAARNVTRLMTEKRLLRQSLEMLNTWAALPPELTHHLFQHVQSITMTHRGSAHSDGDREDAADKKTTELLLPSWRLSLLLQGLNFPRDMTLQALARIAEIDMTEDADALRDPDWNLSASLNILAVAMAANTDLDFTHPQVEAEKAVNDNVQAEDERETPEIKHTPTTNQDKGNVETQTAHEAEVDEPSDLESELESDQMIEKYLSLMKALHQLDPDALDQGKKKGRKGTTKLTTPNIQRSIAHDQRILRVQRLITKIQSDVLFDQQSADEAWSLIHIDLKREDAERRRLGVDVPKSEKMSSAKQSANDVAEDSDIIVGELFDSLPDVGSNVVEESKKTSSSKAKKMRRFNTWTGISPRRVLQEACKARDNASKLTAHVITESHFQCTHSLTIEWAKPQPSAINSIIQEVNVTQKRTQIKFSMDGIACPDRTQSEGYICTVALYHIFSMSPKEKAAYLRLPAVFKDLWLEMVDIEKERQNEADRNDLRQLREVVTQKALLSTPRKFDREIYNTNGDIAHPDITERQKMGPSDELRSQWAEKAASRPFLAMARTRTQLPINRYKEELLDAMHANQVVIVCGETGCGKSTQVPAYILENELSQGRDCRIYCTEPRRISAISLARRVSEELGERKHDVGTSRSLVGFAVRLDSRVTQSTKLVYATTGIVMRMLESSKDLRDVTHLLLDEVHERSIESDFLLIILKTLLTSRPDLRVVLMSATLDAEKFSTYLGGAPIFNIPGRTYPVKVLYLEDAVEKTRFRYSDRYSQLSDDSESDIDRERDTGGVEATSETAETPNYNAQTHIVVSRIDEYKIPYDLIVHLLENLPESEFAAYSRATLVFMPGIAEIRRLTRMLLGHRAFSKQCEVIALHSSIATEEQERAFYPPRPGNRKIVLATNIAETGITIPDITCVIDTGKHKEMRFDERRQLSHLSTSFISQANAKQRRGRAGRVQNGLCFHLVSRGQFAKMAGEQTPEMLRLSLQDLVLRVKICGLGNIMETLSQALDPPSIKNIRRAIDALQDVKALLPNQELTPMGRRLAKLPLDVYLGKLLILGCIFSCLDTTLTLAAILSSKSPFAATMNSQSQADQARLALRRSDSDLLTAFNAYASWRRVSESKPISAQNFCRKNFLSIQTLGNIEDLKGQLFTSLLDASFISLDSTEAEQQSRSRHTRRGFVEVPTRYTINDSNDLLINSLVASAFYPKLLRREGNAWRNVATNQSISVHPSSVNKTPVSGSQPPKYLSFYHIMGSGNKFYNAHETSAVDEMAILLLCGEVEFRMYAGVIAVDGTRIRYAVREWRTMAVLKALAENIRRIVDAGIRHPGRELTDEDKFWMDGFLRVFQREDRAELVKG